MKYCKTCLNPDTRPNTFFDENGICPVCVFEAQKQKAVIDWDARRRELLEIVEWGRRHSKSSYDCIVTVSGGKDSMRQAMFARDELGAKPLLVSCQYPPEQLAERGAHNLANLISLGFDTVALSLDPQLWKRLMREGFYRFGNWCKSTEMALYAIPVHVAIAYQIPLIFYGENPALTIGEQHGGLDGDASRLKLGNTIRGGPRALTSEDMTAQDLHFYEYPPDGDMEYANLRLVYLGYYIPDWAGHQNADFAIRRGLEVRHEPAEKTGDLWGFTGLDEDFRLVNQMLKYLKLGFGHVTDQVCEGINAGMFDRETAWEYVRQYDGKCDREYIARYCRYLGISEEEFWRVAESFRNRSIWKRNAEGEWELDADE